jgi:hypothetical protein
MRQVLNYTIHDILTFRIERDKRKDLLKDLNLLFLFFETKEGIADPDVVLNIGKFTPTNKGCYVIDHKYYVKENYFYCKDSEGKARWEVEILGFEDGKTTINFDGTVFGLQSILIPDFLPQNLLLRPLIEYKLAKRGYFLIHAGAVSKNNQAYLLEGRGGAFKTTLAMDFVRSEGFKFMADDRVIIHKDKVLSFPFHHLFFTFRVKHLPTEDPRGFWDKARLVKYLWNKSEHVTNDVKMANSSTLRALLSIVKTNKEKISLREANLEETIDKLIMSMEMEMVYSPRMTGMSFGRYLRYMLAYSFVFPNSQIATYWDDLRDGLERILENVPISEMEIPENYNSNTFNRVYEHLGGFI